MITNQNTSESALRLNVNSAGSGLLCHWIGLLKAETFVVCTAQEFTVKNANDCSLIVWRKPFNGEPTMRKICSQKSEINTPKLRILAHQMKDALVGHYFSTKRVFNAIIGEVQYVRN